jgi:hypothetical protein
MTRDWSIPLTWALILVGLAVFWIWVVKVIL